jgi:subtilisin family serine protease
MLKNNNYLVIIGLCISLIGCNSLKRNQIAEKKNQAKSVDINAWQNKDFSIDGIPGVSLDRVYNEKIVAKTAKTIIVAVLDTQIDLNHEDLQGQLWVNENETPNNGIDDDSNGYVDDINGWNFVGKKNGDFLVWGNFEYVRLIRKWDNYFKDKDQTKLSNDYAYNFKEYKRALTHLEYYQNYYQNWKKSLLFSIDVFQPSKDALKKIFPKENYTHKDLDSVYQIYKTNDKTYWQRRDDNDRDLGALIDYMHDFLDNGDKNLEDIVNQKVQVDSILEKNLNVAYNERDYIKDNQKILEKGYGNNNVSNYKEIEKHSTEVSGIIAANRNNKIGIQGFSNNIKIMPLSISISGDEHDKDIAMAIYYAVDNGAKVINMSFGKEFSLEQQWVTDAIKYAEEKNVLIVHVAGNNKKNIDISPYYPIDYSYKSDIEISSNFINVGATTNSLDSTFVYKSSSYGKKNVDLFAPGDRIYTTIQGGKYETDSGTSLAAPLVSGTAALIWLYYPKLTVQEVKQIILESGTPYDFEVLIPGEENKKAPFKDLSKSGKVLNVYNALKMAKGISSKK